MHQSFKSGAKKISIHSKEEVISALTVLNDLDRFFFARQDTELVDDPRRHWGQFVKRLLEIDRGGDLQLYRFTNTHTNCKEK